MKTVEVENRKWVQIPALDLVSRVSKEGKVRVEESSKHEAGRETDEAAKPSPLLCYVNTEGDKSTQLQHQVLPAKDSLFFLGL